MTQDWETCSLADICEIQSTLVDPRESRHLDLPHVGAGNIESGTGRVQAIQSAREEELISGKFHFDDSVVLYSKIRPYLMKVARPDFSGLCSADIYPLAPKPGRAERDFLFYMLLTDSFTEYAIRGSARAGMPKVNRDHLFAYKTRTPPIAEQRRIVAILDEAFAGIATAKANVEKNLRNTREWSARQLATALGAASAGGRSDALEKLVAPSCTLSYGIVQPGDEVSGGLPVVRPVDLGDKTVYADGLKRIDPALARSYARTTLEGNDLLLCVRGTTGTVAIADPTLAGANVTRGIVPIRFDPQTISQALGYYLLRSEPVQAQIRAKTYGTALMQINIGDLRKIVIAFPPLEEQAALVEKLDAIQEAADQLADIYARKLAALDELKRSLLHQAFTGGLS